MRKPTVATPLRQLRKARTMNQTALAGLVGVSQQTIAKYERGVVVPPVAVQARLAAILGVSVADVFPQPESVAV